MKKFTKLIMLMMILLFSSSIIIAQVTAPSNAGISKEELSLMQQRVPLNPGAQTQSTPIERINAKGVTYVAPANGGRSGNIHLELTVDSWWGEASYNLWDYDAGAYYWGSDQTFSYGGETQVWDLALTEFSNYDVDCWDTFGDGGIGGNISNTDTGWPITSWGAGDYGSYGAFPFVAYEGIAPPPAVNTFPYLEDFEDGLADDMVLTPGSYSGVAVQDWAANSSSYGLGLEGGSSSSGWGGTPSTYAAAFDPSKASHQPQADIGVEPDGGPGFLHMRFDLKMGYSFNKNYSWFRVLVNGTAITDVDGNLYFQPNSHSDPFVNRVYDLSAYQGAPFSITLQGSFKYRHNYSNEGDIACVDNFRLWYLLPPGSIDGHVFNGSGLTIAGATVGIPDLGLLTTSAPDGYYSFDPVEVGTWDIQGWKEGYNLVTSSVTVYTAANTVHDIILTQPTMIINPLQLNETLNPNEWLKDWLGILNTGDGPLYWTAEVIYPPGDATSGSNAINVTTGKTPVFVKSTGPDNSALAENGGKPFEPSEATRDLFACNEGSLFANNPIGAGNAYWSQYGGPYQQYQRVQGLSDDWNTVTFWGVFLSGTPTTEDFFIGVYADGSLPGAEIASYMIPLDPIATGEVLLGSYPIYQWIAIIDAQTETDFYISCQATSQMYWLLSPTGTGNAFSGPAMSLHEPLALCIEGGGTPSGWLSLDAYEGTVAPMGGSYNLGVNFDASGFEAGDYVTADIVISSDPNVGTITIPCSMTVMGDPLSPPTDLEVTIVNDITGQVFIEWLWTADAFLYFTVYRDGGFVGNTTDQHYTDFLPDYGEYCYTVVAVYDEGQTSPAGPECVMWPNPTMNIDPYTLYGEVWPDHQITLYTEISNTGVGTLAFEFPDYVGGDQFDCDYQVAMYDSYGDGWNGGTLTLYVDGTIVLNAVTLSSGSGPQYLTFSVYTGAEITSTFVCGGWCYECSYEIINSDGTVVYTDGAGGANPTGIPAGALYALCPMPSFISTVVPAQGTISPGSSQTIAVTYDATDFPAGLYDEWLNINSNDPNRLEDSIYCEMLVYIPGQFEGYVTDCNTSDPIAGVSVVIGTWSTMTDPTGYYSLMVDAGTYDAYFSIIGYQDVTVSGVVATQGTITTLDVEMCEEAYPPGWVTATVNDDDTECDVVWTWPWGPYEVIYDDGSAEDYLVWMTALNINAVKFTPAGHPATVIGGKVYVGDGSFPSGANFIGTTFGMAVYDDDGTDGLPGTILDSIEVTVDNYGWVDFGGLSATITEGEFYLGMIQGGIPPFAAPIGVDYTIPTVYRSYNYDAGVGMWALSPYQDFMLRAVVSGPQNGMFDTDYAEKVYPVKPIRRNFISLHTPRPVPGYVKSGKYVAAPEYASAEENRDVTSYTIARFSDFAPGGPILAGTETVLQTGITGLTYNDAAFIGLDEGWYGYGVKAAYTNGDESPYTASNIVGHLKKVAVTINVTTTTGENAEGTEIILTGYDYPEAMYTAILDNSQTVTFDPVWKGDYNVYAMKVGYYVYSVDYSITSNMTIDIMLAEKRYPPYNLYVDPITSIATWNMPRITQIDEGFEGATFPPNGWQSTTNSCGWFATEDGSSTYWTIPSWDSQYACSNDDECGSNKDGSVDYLITPKLDLRESPDFSLKFDSYYDGVYGQLASVKYSLDAGATWELLAQMSPSSSWQAIELDLSAFSGMSGESAIWFNFHSDDNGGTANWGSGWAIDNVEVSVGNDSDWPPQGYHVFLDDAYVEVVTETTYTYLDLTWGQTYTASVAALYSSGLSDKDYYTFTSAWLYPPTNLQGITFDNAVNLLWYPPCAPGLYVISERPRHIDPNSLVEYSPTVREIGGGIVTDDLWDLQFNYPAQGASCEAGIETDGNYIYTGWWDGPDFYRYEMDGTYVGSFTIAGVSSVRDYAYDGEFFYGGAASTTCYIMDFENETLEGTINAPIAIRAIAYDGAFDGFWANNWSTNITLFGRDGVQLNSFACGSYSSYYGFAWDNHTDDGPYLWGHSQDGSATIVQMEIATGTETGLTVNPNAITGGSQIAGGLFIHPNIVSGTWTMGGILQLELLYGLECGDYVPPGPGGCTVPDNLLGYNVYRDEAFVEYVEYNDEDSTMWYDYNLQPGTYSYTVTAEYDLSVYGGTGTGESVHEGPVILTVSYGYELPFVEEWFYGTFETQQWIVGCDNWFVNAAIGNPVPSAEFKWDPVLADYDCGIESYPLLGSDIIDGIIYLDFDYMLDDRNETGLENMTVRIWENGNWHNIVSYTNEGDIDWTSEHLNINTFAKGNDFKIGFFANGISSVDILGWYIDNIHVYRVCEAPTELTISKQEYLEYADIFLNWQLGEPPVEEWIQYDDGVNYNAIGLSGGGAFEVSAYWPASSMAQYTGLNLTEVEVYINDPTTTAIIKIYGAGTPTEPGDLLAEKSFDGIAESWITVELDSPVAITGEDIWIGYYGDAPAPPEFFAGCDAGPAVAGFGDMISLDGVNFESMSIAYGLDYNWNIHGFLTNADGETVAITPVEATPVTYTGGTPAVTAMNAAANVAPYNHRDFISFSIYRDYNGGGYELIEEGWADYTYTDVVYAGGDYTYYVIAVYDQCTSDPSNEAWIDIYVGVEELTLEESIEVYPNPAVDYVNVNSTVDINTITVLDYLGQLVYEMKVVENNNIKLNTASYEAGVYFIKIYTEEGIAIKRVTITK